MKLIGKTICLALLVYCAAATVNAQAADPAAPQPGTNEPRVALADAAQVLDAAGRLALEARLRTTALTATPDAPTRNVLIVVTNRSQFFYNYVSGYATFYDGAGVRCGEGLFKLEAFAPNEASEVDTPGLRLTCAPATWRVSALNLLTRATDVAKPEQLAPPPAESLPAVSPPRTNLTAAPPRLEININGRTLPLQLGNPLEIVVGQERMRIVVSPAP